MSWLSSLISHMKAENKKDLFDAQQVIAPFAGLNMFMINFNGKDTLIASENVNIQPHNYKRGIQVKFDSSKVVDKLANYKYSVGQTMDVLLLKSIDKLVF